jgi:hypothetical protein
MVGGLPSPRVLGVSAYLFRMASQLITFVSSVMVTECPVPQLES